MWELTMAMRLHCVSVVAALPLLMVLVGQVLDDDDDEDAEDDSLLLDKTDAAVVPGGSHLWAITDVFHESFHAPRATPGMLQPAAITRISGTVTGANSHASTAEGPPSASPEITGLHAALSSARRTRTQTWSAIQLHMAADRKVSGDPTDRASWRNSSSHSASSSQYKNGTLTLNEIHPPSLVYVATARMPLAGMTTHDTFDTFTDPGDTDSEWCGDDEDNDGDAAGSEADTDGTGADGDCEIRLSTLCECVRLPDADRRGGDFDGCRPVIDMEAAKVAVNKVAVTVAPRGADPAVSVSVVEADAMAEEMRECDADCRRYRWHGRGDGDRDTDIVAVSVGFIPVMVSVSDRAVEVNCLE